MLLNFLLLPSHLKRTLSRICLKSIQLTLKCTKIGRYIFNLLPKVKDESLFSQYEPLYILEQQWSIFNLFILSIANIFIVSKDNRSLQYISFTTHVNVSISYTQTMRHSISEIFPYHFLSQMKISLLDKIFQILNIVKTKTKKKNRTYFENTPILPQPDNLFVNSNQHYISEQQLDIP